MGALCAGRRDLLMPKCDNMSLNTGVYALYVFGMRETAAEQTESVRPRFLRLNIGTFARQLFFSSAWQTLAVESTSN